MLWFKHYENIRSSCNSAVNLHQSFKSLTGIVNDSHAIQLCRFRTQARFRVSGCSRQMESFEDDGLVTRDFGR